MRQQRSARTRSVAARFDQFRHASRRARTRKYATSYSPPISARGNASQQAGLTLAEIAIVSVLVGLLVGGVVAGGSIVTQARIKLVVRSVQRRLRCASCTTSIAMPRCRATTPRARHAGRRARRTATATGGWAAPIGIRRPRAIRYAHSSWMRPGRDAQLLVASAAGGSDHLTRRPVSRSSRSRSTSSPASSASNSAAWTSPSLRSARPTCRPRRDRRRGAAR